MRKRKDNGALAWAAIDLVTCLLLVVYTLIAPPPKPWKPVRIETIGTYAVVLSWNKKSDSDVDLYVGDPEGHVVFFNNTSAGLMNLEHDDIPVVSETLGTKSFGNHERVVIRGSVTGEYTVNAHLYMDNDLHPITITIQLWKLRGEDQMIKSTTVTLSGTGDEKTAFRFTVNAAGNVTSYNDLQKHFVTDPGVNSATGQSFSGVPTISGNNTRAPAYGGNP